MGEEKMHVYVDIRHLEEAFGIDLHELKQGDSLSKLFDALGLLHGRHNCGPGLGIR